MKRDYFFLIFLVFLIIVNLLVLSSFNVSKIPEKKLFAAAYSGLGSEQDADALAEEYDLLVIQDYYEKYIPAMRKANPDIVILLYKTSFICFNPKYQHETIRPDESLPFMQYRDEAGEMVPLIDDYDGGSHGCLMPDYSDEDFITYAINEYRLELVQGDYDGLFLDVIPLIQNDFTYGGKLYDPEGSEVSWDDFLVGLRAYLTRLDSELAKGGHILIPNYAAYIFADELDIDEVKAFWLAADGGLDEFYGYNRAYPLSGSQQQLQEEIRDFTLASGRYYLAYAHSYCMISRDSVIESFPEQGKAYMFPACKYENSFPNAMDSAEYYERI